MSATSPAFLSVRLPPAVRDRLKERAAAGGETMRHLVGRLVERFLSEDGPAPNLARVLATLRSDRCWLNERGIQGLRAFGSVARGEAGPDGDIDLFASFDPGSNLSLVGLASLRAELSDRLGAPVDLVTRESLHAEVRIEAEREAVRVL